MGQMGIVGVDIRSELNMFSGLGGKNFNFLFVCLETSAEHVIVWMEVSVADLEDHESDGGAGFVAGQQRNTLGTDRQPEHERAEQGVAEETLEEAFARFMDDGTRMGGHCPVG